MYSPIRDRVVQFNNSRLPEIVSEVLQLRASFSLDPSQFWSVLDILPVAVLVSTDRRCTHISGNAASRALFRAPVSQNLSLMPTAPESTGFLVYIDGELATSERLPMQRAAATGEPVADSECELRFDDGSRTVISGHTVPIFDRDGSVCGSVGAFVDITERKRLEEENRLLTDELRHRVKNTVAIIQAISRQTIRPLLSSEDFKAYEQRLIAVSKVHDLLFARMWSGGVPVGEIVGAALSPVMDRATKRVAASGPVLNLPPQSALTLIMILHELVTNACKYGSLTRARGRLEIGWRLRRRSGKDLAVLHWKESGGPVVQTPQKFGFGTKMIDLTVKGLRDGDIQVDYLPAGVQCEIVVPCNAVPPESFAETAPDVVDRLSA